MAANEGEHNAWVCSLDVEASEGEHGYLQLMVVKGGGDNVARQWVQGQCEH